METTQTPSTKPASPTSSNASENCRRLPCGHRRGAGFVVVIALAAGLIGGYVGKTFAHGPAGFMGGMMGGGPMAMNATIDPARVDAQIERMMKHVAVELDATPAQREKLAAIAKATAKELLPLRAKVQEARKQAAALAGAPTVDRAALEKLRAEQIALADTVSKRLTQALADAGEVLTPQQRQKIAERMQARQQGHGFWHRG